jgi:hypothetical protein
MKDPHQWSTITCNDRFFILLGLLVLMVVLTPFALAFWDPILVLLGFR